LVNIIITYLKLTILYHYSIDSYSYSYYYSSSFARFYDSSDFSFTCF